MPLTQSEATAFLAAFRNALAGITEGGGDQAPTPTGAARNGATPARRATEPGAVATASDLDSQYGNEEIRRMPSERYWQGGDDYTARRMSVCPADFLEAYARYKDAGATANELEGKPERVKYIAYDRRTAARARGWAKRVRGEGTAAQHGELFGPPTDGSDIPF